MRELDVMTEAIRNAYGAVAQCSRDARVKDNADGVYDVVTDADFASERTIVDAIRVAFPDDAVISEESSPDANLEKRSWVLDPIDGTMNFSRGIPLYGIQAAFLACGHTDAHLRFTNKIWNFLPGPYIAEKAGAVYDKSLQRERNVLRLCSSK